MLRIYNRAGIQFSKHLPIESLNLDKDSEQEAIFYAVQYLNDMVNDKGLSVFVHSCSGHTRASTVVLIYLSLYKLHPDWNNLQRLSEYMQSQYNLSFPNMVVASKII